MLHQNTKFARILGARALLYRSQPTPEHLSRAGGAKPLTHHKQPRNRGSNGRTEANYSTYQR